MTDVSRSNGGLASRFHVQRLKDGLKKYGRTGVVVYLALSTCVTAGFYVAIERNVDVEKLLGMKKSEVDEGLHRDPSFMERMLTGKGSHIALAFLCSKMLVPIKLPVALAITPYVHRWRMRLLSGAAKISQNHGPTGSSGIGEHRP